MSENEYIKKLYKVQVEINRLITREKNRELFLRKAFDLVLKSKVYTAVSLHLIDDEGRSVLFMNSDEAENTDLNQSLFTVDIIYRKKVYGQLSVSDNNAVNAGPEESALLEDIAEDIGYGLNRIDFGDSSSLFEYAIQKMPNTFSFLSADYNYLAVNERYTALFNIPTDEFVGRSASEFYSTEEYENRIKPMFDKCISGFEVDYLLKICFPSFGTRWMHMYYYPHIDEDGQVTGIISHGIDVTETKLTERELFKFRKISEESTQGVAIADMDGKIVYINDYFAELLGYNIEELIGQNHKIMYAQDLNTEIETIENDFRNCGNIEPYLQMHRKKDGTEIPLLLTGIPILDENGKPELLSVTAQDLSNLKKAENKLNLSQVRYRRLVDTVTDTITIITENGIVTEIGESACAKLGFRRDEIIGKDINVLDPDYTLASFQKFWLNVDYDEHMIFESRNCKKDGTTFPVEVSAQKVQIENETFIISVARDITERNQSRERMAAALEKAEEADRLKSAFLANMSHEIRTPLNGILGFSSLMNDPDITPEQQQKYFKIIKQSGHRLLETINALIDISKIESGEAEVEITDVNIRSFLDELYNFFKPEMEDKGLKFILENDLGLNKILKTDHDMLYAVMMNLIKNAVKFTNSGRISFGCRYSGLNYEFFVSDTGIGVAEKKLSHIFDRFIQVDQSLTKKFEGSGLGLSICKEYTELLGGSIRAESELDKGSVFTVVLPDGNGGA